MFPGTQRPRLRGAGAGSQATAGSAARTKVCMHITLHTSGQASSWIPWCIALDPTAPTKAILSMNGCQINGQGQGAHKQEMSYSAMMLMLLLHIKFLIVATPEERIKNETGIEGRRKWGKEE